MQKSLISWLGFAFLIFSTALAVGAFGLILFDISLKGTSHLSFEFLLRPPSNGMTEGGIFPAIIGTLLVTLLTAFVGIPLGIGAGVYLNEYAKNNWLTRLIRLSIRNLAGVPSIVYGLFGLALFVQAMQMGTSLLASGLTLGLMTLPYIISVTEEALKTVPNGMKRRSFGFRRNPNPNTFQGHSPLFISRYFNRDHIGIIQSCWRNSSHLVYRSVFLPEISSQFPVR